MIGSIFLTSVGQILTTQSVTKSLSNTLGPFFPKVGYVGPLLTYLIIGVILILIVILSPKGLESLFRRLYNYLIK